MNCEARVGHLFGFTILSAHDRHVGDLDPNRYAAGGAAEGGGWRSGRRGVAQLANYRSGGWQAFQGSRHEFPRYLLSGLPTLILRKDDFSAEVADQVKDAPSDMTSLKRNRPKSLMYLIWWIPGTEIIVPGVVMSIELVVKNISVAMNPPMIPALGLI